MKPRIVFFSIIFFTVLLIFTEVLLRLAMVFWGYPFLHPSDYIYKGYYKDLDAVAKKDIRNTDNVKDILILGGSVVSTPWSNMEGRLDTILRKRYKNDEKFAFYNVAAAGHTSRDNLIKYELLSKQRFDLVIYYEAINENRANNIPSKNFFPDYSHIKWYNDIYLLRAHPEINITVIPYLSDMLIKAVKDVTARKIYVSQEKVDPRFIKYGGEIKTALSYKENINKIIKIAEKRGDKLLLMSYASYFPQRVKLTGEQKDMDHFAGCNYASPVNIWGAADNVKKGITIHNQILRNLVAKNNVLFLDMAKKMPADSSMFCDVCHVSEPGAQYFARELSNFIIEKNLFNNHQLARASR